MTQRVIQNPKQDSLPAQLIALYETFKNINPNELITFDLSRVAWFSPLLLLPISAYAHSTSSQIIYPPDRSYLNTIQFPQGMESSSELQSQDQIRKNYIPISVLRQDSGADRDRFISVFSNLVLKAVGLKSGLGNPIVYTISELTTNIFEHSKQKEGYIFAQFYPQKGFLDLCIIDRGRGLARAYQEENGLTLSDREAINEVMKGISTKPGHERGYGVRTSKDMVCQGLGGEFILVSGSAALMVTKQSAKVVTLPYFNWPGVIIAYRIPRTAVKVDITPYLE